MLGAHIMSMHGYPAQLCDMRACERETSCAGVEHFTTDLAVSASVGDSCKVCGVLEETPPDPGLHASDAIATEDHVTFVFTPPSLTFARVGARVESP